MLRKLIEIGFVLLIFFKTDKHMRIGIVRSPPLHFRQIAAHMAFYPQLFYHVHDNAGVFIPNRHHIELLHIKICGNIQLFPVLNLSYRLIVQHFLRYDKTENTALPDTAPYRNRSSHFLNKFSGNRKSESDTAFLTIPPRINLAETLE